MAGPGSSVEVLGADSVARGLAEVGAHLDDMTAAATEAGNAVRTRAAQGAPVDTGALSRSITASVTGSTVEVTAGAPYAGYQEYGTRTVPASPFMRPALEAAQAQVIDAYTGEIQKELAGVRGA